MIEYVDTPCINWQMYPKAIPDDIIDDIIASVGETEKASIFSDNPDDVRKSRVAWLDNNIKVLNLLYDYVNASNQEAFHFNIFKKANIQYTEYHGSESGHYDWHHDIFWERNDGLNRKLSVTIQLSNPDEYEGGNFEFNEVLNPDINTLKEKGTVLVFPSYLRHRVTPVTEGVRRSLVAWFEGPKWR